jgi:hypothetical protein
MTDAGPRRDALAIAEIALSITGERKRARVFETDPERLARETIRHTLKSRHSDRLERFSRIGFVRARRISPFERIARPNPRSPEHIELSFDPLIRLRHARSMRPPRRSNHVSDLLHRSARHRDLRLPRSGSGRTAGPTG